MSGVHAASIKCNSELLSLYLVDRSTGNETFLSIESATRPVSSFVLDGSPDLFCAFYSHEGHSSPKKCYQQFGKQKLLIVLSFARQVAREPASMCAVGDALLPATDQILRENLGESPPYRLYCSQSGRVISVTEVRLRILTANEPLSEILLLELGNS